MTPHVNTLERVSQKEEPLVFELNFQMYWRNRLRRCETVEEYEEAIEVLLLQLGAGTTKASG